MSHISFPYKINILKVALKVNKYSGHFPQKYGCRELSKIAQSGHTDFMQALRSFIGKVMRVKNRRNVPNLFLNIVFFPSTFYVTQ